MTHTRPEPTADTDADAPPVVDLDDPSAADPSLTGQKAAALAELRQAGFPVPGGAVITAAVQDGTEALRSAVAQAIDLVGEGPFAVRSSGLAEDLADASYAGQYETVLDVDGLDAVVGAARTCLASARFARVTAYRDGPTDDRAADAAGMAVLVQRLVPADAAGVAFTANPVTGDDEVLVSAVTGLGDRLAAGEVTPDEWVARDGGIEPLTAPDNAIDHGTAADVVALARAVEEHVGSPQDIEWAVVGGEVRLLQARPITALPVEPAIEVPEEGTWMKDSAHLPEPICPLTATTYLPALETGVAVAFERFGILLDGVQQRAIGGEAYVRPLPPGGKDGPPPPWWLLGIVARLAPPLRRKLRTARNAVRGRLHERVIDRWWNQWRDQLIGRAEQLRAVDLTSLDDAALEAHLHRTLELLRDGQGIHFLLFVPYAMALRDLATACDDLLGWSIIEALELVGGLSETTSGPARDLERLADTARGIPDAVEVIASLGADTKLEEARNALAAISTEIADALADHIDRFGHRVLGYGPGKPTVAERPGVVLGLLSDLLAGDAGADTTVSALGERREETLERARTELVERGVPSEARTRFERVVERARTVWPVREDNLLFADGIPSGLVRYAALEIGRRLVERGRLVRREDAVWLELAELREALHGADGDLRGRVARRRAEHAWVKAHPGPQVLGPEPSPPPDLRALPAEVRATTGALLWMIGAEYRPDDTIDAADVLRGAPGSPGRHTGTVRVVHEEAQFDRVRPDEVLVCPITTPAWSMLFARVGAVVTDVGGALSHAAIVAREHGVPAVLATKHGTNRLRDGQTVTVDGTTGTVQIHDDPTTTSGDAPTTSRGERRGATTDHQPTREGSP